MRRSWDAGASGPSSGLPAWVLRANIVPSGATARVGPRRVGSALVPRGGRLARSPWPYRRSRGGPNVLPPSVETATAGRLSESGRPGTGTLRRCHPTYTRFRFGSVATWGCHAPSLLAGLAGRLSRTTVLWKVWPRSVVRDSTRLVGPREVNGTDTL